MVKVVDGKEDIGFIAQELQHVLPETVYGDYDSGYKVKYLDIISLCIQAIKEQAFQLDESEKRLLEIEHRLKK